MVLEKIQKENDIKKLTHKELELLKDEIRQFLIESISVTGGHLASNLGVVELTMALHLCFNLPKDKIVWDVGHQSYTHKILTGRKDGFSSAQTVWRHERFPKGWMRATVTVLIQDIAPHPYQQGLGLRQPDR